uniref:Putative secreted protein n=1 Tax=Ixodes ricinus TaxID=34613 RepID=A0A6B0U179_IXORI
MCLAQSILSFLTLTTRAKNPFQHKCCAELSNAVNLLDFSPTKTKDNRSSSSTQNALPLPTSPVTSF